MTVQLVEIVVENFRALKKCEIPLGRFSCVVGENNSGKSTLLLAIELLKSDGALKSTDFYDPAQPVVVEAQFDKIDDDDFERIADSEHRRRLKALVDNGELRVRAEFHLGAKCRFTAYQTVPRDERLRPNNVAASLKGKNGAELKAVVKQCFPTHLDAIGEAKTQKAVKEAVAAIVDGLPDTELTREPDALPSGIPNSVRSLFPETVYIPAVTDPRDELRNKATTTFGRLLGIVLRLLEQDEQLNEIEVALDRLTKLLNRVRGEDGQVVDGRLQQIQDIESLLQGYVSETFPTTRRIEISVPRPDLKTLFDNANVQVDDGVLGDVDSKGDGMKRALVFALLRTYVEMKEKLARSVDGNGPKPKDRPYLFLFEEPELYLHPQAQLILFAALKNLSRVSQVLVTTHSPQFLVTCSPILGPRVI